MGNELVRLDLPDELEVVQPYSFAKNKIIRLNFPTSVEEIKK